MVGCCSLSGTVLPVPLPLVAAVSLRVGWLLRVWFFFVFRPCWQLLWLVEAWLLCWAALVCYPLCGPPFCWRLRLLLRFALAALGPRSPSGPVLLPLSCAGDFGMYPSLPHLPPLGNDPATAVLIDGTCLVAPQVHVGQCKHMQAGTMHSVGFELRACHPVGTCRKLPADTPGRQNWSNVGQGRAVGSWF